MIVLVIFTPSYHERFRKTEWLTPRRQQTQIIKDFLYASCASYMLMNETIRDKIIFLLLCDVIYDVVINRVATTYWMWNILENIYIYTGK